MVETVAADYTVMQAIWNLIIDPIVKQFYADLGKPKTVHSEPVAIDGNSNLASPQISHSESNNGQSDKVEHKPSKTGKPVMKPKRKPVNDDSKTSKGGRPGSFPTGSSNMRIPSELTQPLNNALAVCYPGSSKGGPDNEKISKLIQMLNSFS